MNPRVITLLAVAAEVTDDPPAPFVVARRRVWVHSINRGRGQYGEYHRLCQELRLDEDRFKVYFRLNRQQCEGVLTFIGPTIAKMNTNYRESISPAQRLCICLRYLSTGDSYRSIAFSYRVGFCTVARIVKSVCEAIWQCMVSTYMPVPGAEDWRKIAGDYEKLADFPNCLGAIDGKHVVIQAPPSTGSQYFNYKGAFSIVLLAVVDARYRFRVVDVGAYGRSSDGGTLSSSAFGTALRLGNLDLPPDQPLPGADHLGPQPHVFIGDEAFPLRRNLLRPYPGQNLGGERRIFNFRLSHARRIVECAFGILANQWRLYRRVLGVSPEVAESAVKATCILHNYMRWDGEGEDGPRTPTVPSQGAVQSIPRVGSNNASREAVAVRETFNCYFSSLPGRVTWQDGI
ncbi:protein ALP1-like [Gadus morhua]|uniref:protein ALP1-like n=1 Tax=Gadus morhua TaxID=8049 RepID=UPI0011B69010|nr:protein ALP1-like [Gadus morhua]